MGRKSAFFFFNFRTRRRASARALRWIMTSRILVLEDEPGLARHLTRIYAEFGDVTVLASGEEAIERLRGAASAWTLLSVDEKCSGATCAATT